MVFNATFINISVISWQSVLLWWRKPGNPEKTTDLLKEYLEYLEKTTDLLKEYLEKTTDLLKEYLEYLEKTC